MIGKQLLITRGALTTFSIANDVSKYFAIIPAMFAAFYPGLNALNVMRYSFGDHFQRAHHRRAYTAGAARREIPAGERVSVAEPQFAHLWGRRHYRAIPRH
jgi:hypothetical protein